MVHVLNEPSVRPRFTQLGLDIAPAELQTPEGLATFPKAEVEKWWPIFKSANIRAEWRQRESPYRRRKESRCANSCITLRVPLVGQGGPPTRLSVDGRTNQSRPWRRRARLSPGMTGFDSLNDWPKTCSA
jgi:hypothetical protein